MDGVHYRLLKFLYGLKDAPKGFNDQMSAHVLRGGYSQSKHDQCLYYKWTNFYTFIYILVHVDDFYCAATTEELLQEFSIHLQSRYEITEKAELDYLGMDIKTTPDGTKYFSRPKQYQIKILVHNVSLYVVRRKINLTNEEKP